MGAGEPGLQRPRNERRFPPPGVTPVAVGSSFLSKGIALWVRHFQAIPELVPALDEYRALYNQHWLIERLGFQPLVQARHCLALQPAT